MTTQQRPNPEKFLKRAQEEERQEKSGKLKIYFGAAPGVGKTYTMLQDALIKRTQGLDVVIGIVESHGRAQIETLLKNFEILPLQIVDYRNKPLQELDLDSALKRNPGLILIDEMAHTNAPGLRHEKRWQDIKELLLRGINVYTTLNVQHIESLNDAVSQIIGTRIKETIPDSALELADIIELVDLSPEDLLKRLEEGKIYFSAQAQIAAEHFFRKGNLIALRELALRITAEYVEAQVILYRQLENIKHIWPTKDKILVCVGPGAESINLIRVAKRMATSLHAEWVAVYVDTQRLRSPEEQRNNAIQNLRFAERLGAETRLITGFDITKEIMNFAREQNVTQIMVWKHIHSRWKDFLLKSLADTLVYHSGEIDVHIVTPSLTDKISKGSSIKSFCFKRPSFWKSYIISVGVVALATFIDFLLYSKLSSSNLIMIYLLGVTIVARFGRIGASLLASILSVLAYDFFFVSPIYSFIVADIQSLFTLVVMLFVSLIISHLTILTRRQTKSARLSEKYSAAMHTLSHRLVGIRGVNKLLQIAVRYVGETFNSQVVILLPENEQVTIRAHYKTGSTLSPKEQGVAQWVYDMGQMAGSGTDTLSFSEALYLPLLATQGNVGVLRIIPVQPHYLFTPEQMHLLESCANQIAIALEVELNN